MKKPVTIERVKPIAERYIIPGSYKTNQADIQRITSQSTTHTHVERFFGKKSEQTLSS